MNKFKQHELMLFTSVGIHYPDSIDYEIYEDGTVSKVSTGEVLGQFLDCGWRHTEESTFYSTYMPAQPIERIFFTGKIDLNGVV